MSPLLLRGWKEICAALGTADKRTARKDLKAAGLLRYTRTRPVVSVEALRLSVLAAHLDLSKLPNLGKK